MNIEMLQDFFFWSMIINCVMYALTALATIFLRDFLCWIHKILFDLEKDEVLKLVQRYLATYKLLITVFNFTPWIAIMIIK
jgi:hypothetical protein